VAPLPDAAELAAPEAPPPLDGPLPPLAPAALLASSPAWKSSPPQWASEAGSTKHPKSKIRRRRIRAG
jgi:hypothetical protein